ncbi:MAG: ribosomal protein S18-alanine N-acetyltransferase [Deltaproteobacteria bacterium]|nr:ribosomal protein S18-alanine N-acetyltransferase [Deltaproteobacteria bacterium]
MSLNEVAIESREPIEIRGMTERDLDEVMQIERMSFPTPWSRRLFERELLMPYAQAFVAVEFPPGKVLGYLCFWLVARETHILNLAVHPERRRRGIASRLLRFAVDYSREKGTEEIILEVRRSNYKAISLYQNFQFQPQGIRPRYYSDSGEDAVIMGLRLAKQTSATSL